MPCVRGVRKKGSDKVSLLRLRTSESGAGLNQKKRLHWMKKKRTLVLTAECEYPNGKPAHFFVYYTSGGFEIIGPDRQRHRCHLSVKTRRTGTNRNRQGLWRHSEVDHSSLRYALNGHEA